MLQRNLQDMWLECSSVNTVNLAKKNLLHSTDIKFFLGDYFLWCALYIHSFWAIIIGPRNGSPMATNVVLYRVSTVAVSYIIAVHLNYL